MSSVNSRQRRLNFLNVGVLSVSLRNMVSAVNEWSGKGFVGNHFEFLKLMNGHEPKVCSDQML